MSYYSMLSSVMSSPFTSENVWFAAREQRSAILWTMFATTVGSLTLYYKGPEVALSTVFGILRNRPLPKQFIHSRGHPKSFSAADVAGGFLNVPLNSVLPQLYSGSLDGSGEYSTGVPYLQGHPNLALFNKSLGHGRIVVRRDQQRAPPLEID